MSNKLKILIVDDHAIVRDGLAAILKFQKDMAVVGEADDGQSAIQKAQELHPDVILMDLMMPNMNGADATAAIPSTRQRDRNRATSFFMGFLILSGMKLGNWTECIFSVQNILLLF